MRRLYNKVIKPSGESPPNWRDSPICVRYRSGDAPTTDPCVRSPASFQTSATHSGSPPLCRPSRRQTRLLHQRAAEWHQMFLKLYEKQQQCTQTSSISTSNGETHRATHSARSFFSTHVRQPYNSHKGARRSTDPSQKTKTVSNTTIKNRTRDELRDSTARRENQIPRPTRHFVEPHTNWWTTRLSTTKTSTSTKKAATTQTATPVSTKSQKIIQKMSLNHGSTTCQQHTQSRRASSGRARFTGGRHG